MKILLLSCPTGGGHNSCANYILEELKSNKIDCDFMDFFDIVNKKAKDLSKKIYLSSLKNNGLIFKNAYRLGELYSNSGIISPVYLANKRYKKKLSDYITNNKYTLVIATHLFPALTLTAIKKDKNLKNIPFLFVATDYEPCPFINETDPDYFVTQKGLESDFKKRKIATKKLLLTGIPVSSKFIDSAKNIREKLNIKNEKMILIMLGSMGFGHVLNIVYELLKENNAKVVVVCGSNKKLSKELKSIKNKNLIIMGFVNNINDLIYSSDLVLTKPGGLSTTEVAVMNKPVLHIYPIPGIETYNARFFAKRKMSFKCDTESDILKYAHNILNNKLLSDRLINNQKKYINTYSAKDLVEFIKNNY